MTLSAGVVPLPTAHTDRRMACQRRAVSRPRPGAACQAAHAQETKLVPPPRLERGTSRSTI
jgi:hypothetical protein